MNKTEQRKLMKALAISNAVIDHQIRKVRAYQFEPWSSMHLPYESPEANKLSIIHHKNFKADRPALDKRRYKRFNKIHKNIYIIGECDTFNNLNFTKVEDVIDYGAY